MFLLNVESRSFSNSTILKWGTLHISFQPDLFTAWFSWDFFGGLDSLPAWAGAGSGLVRCGGGGVRLSGLSVHCLRQRPPNWIEHSTPACCCQCTHICTHTRAQSYTNINKQTHTTPPNWVEQCTQINTSTYTHAQSHLNIDIQRLSTHDCRWIALV